MEYGKNESMYMSSAILTSFVFHCFKPYETGDCRYGNAGCSLSRYIWPSAGKYIRILVTWGVDHRCIREWTWWLSLCTRSCWKCGNRRRRVHVVSKFLNVVFCVFERGSTHGLQSSEMEWEYKQALISISLLMPGRLYPMS